MPARLGASATFRGGWENQSDLDASASSLV
jgi:hypothetical protein